MLPIIPEDKANHLIYGVLSFIILKFIGLPVMYTLIGVFVVGVIKEYMDYKVKSRVKLSEHIMDIVWTVIGGIAGLLCVWV